MNPKLLELYEQELEHVRETAAEFAALHPRVGKWLALENLPVADPYVERLLEGFAFLTARVRHQMEEEFPRFTQALLDSVAPDFLCPIPSMAIVQIPAKKEDTAAAAGYEIPRQTVLRGAPAGRAGTRCEYRTAHSMTVFPLEIAEARYYAQDIGVLNLPDSLEARSALRLRLRVTCPMPLNRVECDRLSLHLCGSGPEKWRIYELLFSSARPLVVDDPAESSARRREIVSSSLSPLGFGPDESLLPRDPRCFDGYRLLREYFAMPERFLFAQIKDLRPSLARARSDSLDLIIPFRSADKSLEGVVSAANFALFCTPAINLFPRDADRVPLNQRVAEHPIIVDRTRPNDFEVYRVQRATGYGASAGRGQAFRSFYAARSGEDHQNGAFFAVHRVPRKLNAAERKFGARSQYAGSEVLVSLVDSANAPYGSDLRQLAASVLATNRDLSLLMPLGAIGAGDFSVDVGLPMGATLCRTGPTAPRPAPEPGQHLWKLISHLTLNYLSLTDTQGHSESGTLSLREMLHLYTEGVGSAALQVEGIQDISYSPITRRVPIKGPPVFARGLEVTVTLDDLAFGGMAFVFATVLEQFLSSYVAINSFTETVLQTVQRGEIKRWPARSGSQRLL